MLSAIAYYILFRAILAEEGPRSKLAAAVGKDQKGMISLVLYAISIPMAFVSRWVSQALFVLVALMWLVPYPCQLR